MIRAPILGDKVSAIYGYVIKGEKEESKVIDNTNNNQNFYKSSSGNTNSKQGATRTITQEELDEIVISLKDNDLIQELHKKTTIYLIVGTSEYTVKKGFIEKGKPEKYDITLSIPVKLSVLSGCKPGNIIAANKKKINDKNIAPVIKLELKNTRVLNDLTDENPSKLSMGKPDSAFLAVSLLNPLIILSAFTRKARELMNKINQRKAAPSLDSSFKIKYTMMAGRINITIGA